MENFYRYLNNFKDIINFQGFFHLQDYYMDNLIYLQNHKKFLLLDFIWLSSLLLVNTVILKTVYSFYIVDPISKNSKILTQASYYESYNI
jgi:maltodextrin utilization protein YvdJ